MKLQPGLTVQSDERGHYAYCVRCRWRSLPVKYKKAQALASTPGAHPCERTQ